MIQSLPVHWPVVVAGASAQQSGHGSSSYGMEAPQPATAAVVATEDPLQLFSH